MKYNILVVDDDENQASIIQTIFSSKYNYKTTFVDNGQKAIDILSKGEGCEFDLVLLDINMSNVSGFDVIREVKPICPEIPIVVRTGMEDVDIAVEAMRGGATDFVKKTATPEMLKKIIDNVLRKKVLNQEISLIKDNKKNNLGFNNVLRKSDIMEEVVTLGTKVSKSDIPILLEGESGTGKDLMAKAIHFSGDRFENPFITVNCGAIPANLVESILFGHEKGAFTGATYKTFGKFREADKGTIFLDEVGELPLQTQVKLLRTLQEGEVDPIGSKKTVKVNVRVISATNLNLENEVAKGNFREDLFYRLSVFPIEIPALRKRKEDIELIALNCMNKFAKSESKQIDSITDDALHLLKNYKWPGNVRQLKNYMFKAVVLCDGNMLDIEDFPQIFKSYQKENYDDIVRANAISKNDNIKQFFIDKNSEEFKTLDDIQKEVISSALSHYNGHMSEVSKKLGISRSTLYRKLDDYDLKTPN